ncbi:MAG TPA: plastocyanin/azurin family copper-binding protein [Solirubrobacterales bacterium]|jgi:plastocyanin|nr:plastocyanin/azurin family copper-binding protein [Solirubrobacterales bacterium]
MSAAAPRPVRLGLACLAATAMTSGSLALAAPAASAEGCAWQRHSKPVFKRIKRHGRLRRVKQLKHWWSCDAQPATFPPVASLPEPAALETPPAKEPEPQISHLSVKAIEYSYTLSHSEIGAGETIVELNNQGDDPHNLKLQLEGSGEPPLEVPEAAAKKQTAATFTLAPGTYRLYCSLFTHDAKGMHATLVVAPG